MKKFGFLLLAAFASINAKASEVGATFPQLANSTALMAVAIAETGASASLAIEPDKDVVQTAQHSRLDRYIENASAELSTEIEQRILQALPIKEAAFANR